MSRKINLLTALTLSTVPDNGGNEDVNAGDRMDRALPEEQEAPLAQPGTAAVKPELVEVE